MSYPARNLIPIHLVATSEDDRVIDLVSGPSINVQLCQVMAFGKDIKIKSGFSIRDLSSFDSTEWPAKAQWEIRSHSRQLPLTKEYPRRRWCVKIKGQLHQNEGIELTRTIRLPNYSLVVRSFSLSGAYRRGLMSVTVLCVFLPILSRWLPPCGRLKEGAFYGRNRAGETRKYHHPATIDDLHRLGCLSF
jgi:hypothetical protein